MGVATSRLAASQRLALCPLHNPEARANVGEIGSQQWGTVDGGSEGAGGAERGSQSKGGMQGG